MISVLSSALGGLHAASARFEQAAENVVRASSRPEAIDRNALGGRPVDRPVTGTGFDTDPAGAAVDMRLAANSYKASIAVLKSVDRMQDALLDITS